MTTFSSETAARARLAARLHDPPEKPYDFGPRHQERSSTHAESFGVADLWKSLAHNPDWSAAAAGFQLQHEGHLIHLGLVSAK